MEKRPQPRPEIAPPRTITDTPQPFINQACTRTITHPSTDSGSGRSNRSGRNVRRAVLPDSDPGRSDRTSVRQDCPTYAEHPGLHGHTQERRNEPNGILGKVYRLSRRSRTATWV